MILNWIWHTMPYKNIEAFRCQHVTLWPPHQAAVVENLVACGRYQNASEVLREGLRLVEKRESEDSLRLEALQNAVQIGLADSAAGRYSAFESSESLTAHLRSLATKAIAGT
jgi:antitoxin ParD1/3/4